PRAVRRLLGPCRRGQAGVPRLVSSRGLLAPHCPRSRGRGRPMLACSPSGAASSARNLAAVEARSGALAMATSHPREQPVFGVAFFLSTLGFRSHAVWAERLVPLGLDSRQAAMLL